MATLGKIAVIGAGSWATALAKLLLGNNERINWYVRQERIDDFIRYHRNTVYLSDVTFETDRIDFHSDINDAVADADTLVVAIPSPTSRTRRRRSPSTSPARTSSRLSRVLSRATT